MVRRALLLLCLIAVCFAADNLTPDEPLLDASDATLISSGDKFELGFFSPDPTSPNRYVGIWFYNMTPQTVVWVANRRTPVVGRSGNLSVTSAGMLILSDGNSTIWSSSGSPALANPVARLLDTGNFVVGETGGSGSSTWQSFDLPTDTLLPGMQIGINLTSGRRANLTAWRTAVDPSPGDFVMGVDWRGVPQMVVWRGAQPYWRAGPSNGLYLSGAPQMYTENLAWNVRGYVPLDPCDYYGTCGPYGVCYPNTSPLCQCLPGFHPENEHNWDLLRDWSDGCLRNTNLDCRNGTDGFFKQSGVKLPDTSTAELYESINLDECETRCLSNCSCAAYASANISSGGSGCIIWTAPPTDIKCFSDSGSGQDLYIRLAAADMIAISESSKSNRGRQAMIISVSCAGIFLAALVASVLLIRKMRRSTANPTSSDLFYYSTVSSHNNRGSLREGQEIAVKRLSKTSAQGADEFKNEVMLIAKLQHRNLVRLLGCCIQAGERILMYEYMPHGSLDTFLFDIENRALADWQTRYNIIVGIARGLLYLHHDSRYRIIHRDLKLSNILLDKDLTPKISDFGMARIFGGDEMMGNTTKVVGTYGYMSPEYAMDGIFSIKSDVFSFGVIVLEILWSLWKEDKALELVDDSMAQSFPINEVLACIKVGLLCVQERPEDRPTMSSVLLMLSSDASMLPEPKPPGFVVTKEPSETDTSTSKGDSLTRNHLSITVLDGR
ncbi:hypothetical protein ZIOFF_046151 [Zingiber officinale]|uniref:Receptor-like serine/threonine-protein kinase n=1 Tax=Zingiber officinale TaxID=94328 RepID=A0A8J5G520_ZINOF|nr:hypothetical protein ZIOFF_046151 [Zingiber officinale]